MMEISNKLKNKASKIKYFFTDVDGTLTDGGVYYSQAGELLKRFSLRDGTGYFLLNKVGIKTGIITSENSPIVQQRVNKLKIDEYIFGTCRKVQSLSKFLENKNITFEEVAYIGDEINDINLLKKCGLSFCVSDADHRVKKVVDVICNNKGGYSAFREAVEILLELKGFDIDKIIEDYL